MPMNLKPAEHGYEKLAWIDEVGGVGDVRGLGSTLKDLQVQEPYE